MQTCMWVCWSTVWFCGAYSPVIIGLTSEETILHFNTQAYFGLGDAGIFHPMVSCLISGRFNTDFLSCQFLIFIQSLWDLFIQSSLMWNLQPKFVLLATPVLSVPCLTAVGSHINPQVLHIFSSFHCSLLKNFCVIQTCALGRASFLASHLANWRFWEQFCSISQEIWHLLVAQFFVKYIFS
jgi:hypothetical protein